MHAQIINIERDEYTSRVVTKNSLKLALEYATREYKDENKIFRNHK